MLFCTCNENPLPSPEFEDFMSVYFSAATENPHVYNLESDRDTTILLGSVAYGGTTDYNRQITASVNADMSLVDAYNEANATAYLPFPSNCFSLSNTTLTIVQNANYSDALYLNLSNVSLLEKGEKYLLPVSISLSESGALRLDETRKTSWYIISIVNPEIIPPFNKNQWSITCDNEWAPAGTLASFLIDGQVGAGYWHTTPGAPLPHWVQVDMKEVKVITGFYFWHRQDGVNEGSPKALKIEVSTNATSWETVYDNGDMEYAIQRLSLPLADKVQARYFKITISATRNGYEYTYFDEIGAYNDVEF
jgi:hypothetical protein